MAITPQVATARPRTFAMTRLRRTPRNRIVNRKPLRCIVAWGEPFDWDIDEDEAA